MSTPPPDARLLDRVDAPSQVSVGRIALEAGVPFGAMAGLVAGAVGGPLATLGPIGLVLRVLAVAIVAGAAFGALFAVLLSRLGALAGRRLHRARQHTHARVAGAAPHQVHAVAVQALATLGQRARRADLARGEASVVLDRAGWIDAGRTEIAVRLEPDGQGGTAVTVQSGRDARRTPRYDFGAGRRGIDRLCDELAARLASPRTAALLAGLAPATALPRAALGALAGAGLDPVASVRSLEPDAPAWLVTALAGDGDARRAVLLRVAGAPDDAAARAAARAARAERSGEAVGGGGFVLVPLAEGEGAAAAARRVHDALLEAARGPGYRGGGTGVRVDPEASEPRGPDDAETSGGRGAAESQASRAPRGGRRG